MSGAPRYDSALGVARDLDGRLRVLALAPERPAPARPAEPEAAVASATLELAVALTERRSLVLLVDLGQASGALAERFDAGARPGLRDVLRGRQEVARVALRGTWPRLIYLPPGHPGPHDVEAGSGVLRQPGLAHLIRKAHLGGATVLLSVPDLALLPAGLAEGAILVGPSGETATTAGAVERSRGEGEPPVVARLVLPEPDRRLIAAGRWAVRTTGAPGRVAPPERGEAGTGPPAAGRPSPGVRSGDDQPAGRRRAHGTRERGRPRHGRPRRPRALRGRVPRGSVRPGRGVSRPPDPAAAFAAFLLAACVALLVVWIGGGAGVSEDAEPTQAADAESTAGAPDAEGPPARRVDAAWIVPGPELDSGSLRLPPSLPFSTFSAGSVLPELPLREGHPARARGGPEPPADSGEGPD